MPVPSHGPSCISKAFPLSCQICGAQVYYYMCNHGSKLFFNSLGPPWPRHSHGGDGDTELGTLINDLIDMKGQYHEDIEARIQAYMHQTGDAISEASINLIQRALGVKRYQFQILQVKPSIGIEGVTGMIMNIDRNINFFNRYKVPDNQIGAGLLGILGIDKFCEITIRERPNETNISREFRVLVPTKIVQTAKLKQNIHIVVKLSSHNVLQKEDVWIADFLEIVWG